MKKLTSVFTENMDCCIYTGSYIVERHHIFGGSNRKKSEKYGFVVPLRPDYHPMAQTYYEENIGSREEFRKEFGKSWL